MSFPSRELVSPWQFFPVWDLLQKKINPRGDIWHNGLPLNVPL